MLDPIALGALIRAKRGQAKITQETLALDVFGDSTRKGDISRIENGKTTPQEATIQKLCTALSISEAELLPIRTARRADEQLADIPSLNREELQNLAARFELESAFTADDTELRRQLTLKADEYRYLKTQIDFLNRQLNEQNEHLKTSKLRQASRQSKDQPTIVYIPMRGQIASGVPIEAIWHTNEVVEVSSVTHNFGDHFSSSQKRPLYLATLVDLLEEAVDNLEWKRAHFLLPAAQNFVWHYVR